MTCMTAEMTTECEVVQASYTASSIFPCGPPLSARSPCSSCHIPRLVGSHCPFPLPWLPLSRAKFSCYLRFSAQQHDPAFPCQVANQQGAYLAKLLSSTKLDAGVDLSSLNRFEYSHKGSLAYVGSDKAVL